MSYTINCGEFKHPITILRVINERDSNYIPIKTTEEYFKCRAKINNYRSTEGLINNGTLATEVKKFWFRYCNSKPIDYSNIILHNGVEYEIIGINHIEEGFKYYEITAQRKI